MTSTVFPTGADPGPDTQAAGAEPLDERTADLAYGQIVVITARWVLVAAGLLLALWDPGDTGELRVQIAGLLLLAIANFYLHAQLITRKPVIELVAYATSAADLVIVTYLVANQGGYASSLYIFYFPAIVAYAVSFHTLVTVVFTGTALAVYALVCINSLGVLIGAEGEPQHIAVRLALIAAVAFCGNLYWRIESGRRREAHTAQAMLERQLHVGSGAARPVSLETLRTPEHEAAEDLFFGQLVTIWARWFLVGSTIVLVLWSAGSAGELADRVRVALMFTAMNFFLHGRYLMDRPANRSLVLLSCGLDIALITLTVAFSAGDRGLNSQYFVFYYPVLVGFAFVFPPRAALAFMALTLTAYAGVCLLVDAGAVLSSTLNQKLLVNRLITLAATGGLAAYYWRIQRDRRRAALGLESGTLGAVRAVQHSLAGGAVEVDGDLAPTPGAAQV